jgi:energy-coupling factor transport system substrate-specific component
MTTTATSATMPTASGRAALALRPRSALAVTAVTLAGLAGFTWPLFAGGRLAGSHAVDAPWLFVALLPLLLAVVFAEVSDGGLDVKGVALLGVLAACGAALRPLGGGATGFQPMFFLLLPAGRVFGRGFGFVLGAVTMFAGALLTGGVGPWLPFEMLGAAWVGFGAGCLPRARGRWEIALLAAYGAVAGLLYGLLLNLWFWPFAHDLPPAIAFVPGGSLATNLLHWVHHDVATSLGFDVPRALTTAALVVIAGRPVLLALRRAARRALFEGSGKGVAVDTPVQEEEDGRGDRAGRREREDPGDHDVAGHAPPHPREPLGRAHAENR